MRHAANRAESAPLLSEEPLSPDVLALVGEAERQAVELRLLHRVRSALESDLDQNSMVQRIVEEVASAFGYTHVSLYLLEEGNHLSLQHQIGYDTVLERIPVTRGVVGRVARTGQPILVEDVARDTEFLAAIPEISSEVCVPFFRQGEFAGVLNVESAGGVRLGSADLRLMIEVSGFLSLAWERWALRVAVRASEERLRLALDAAEMGTWHWNPMTGDLHWSEQMAPLYGLEESRTRLTPTEWFELLHPDDRDHIRRIDEKMLSHGDTYEAEFRILLPNGIVRWLEAKGRVIERAPSGMATRVVGITMDVTGRKRLEEERYRLVQVEAAKVQAEEAQRRIADTLDRLTAAFIAVDHAWRLTFLNSRALELLGRSSDQIIGRELWEAVPEFVGTRFERHLRRAVSTQKTTRFDFPLPSRDRWLEVHAYPAPDGISIYLSDVTVRRQAEEERRRIEARFRSLVQNASDIILILDRDGTVLYASPAVSRVIGYSPSEIEGSDNFFRVHPQDEKRLRRAFVRVAKSPGVSQPIVLRFRHRNGAYRWLEVTATNLFDDPAIKGIIANCRDVTERHEAEFNLWFLAETSAVLGSSLDLETTLTSLARLVVAHLADFCVVDTVDELGRAERVGVAHRDTFLERKLEKFRSRFPIKPEAEFGPGYALRTGRSILYETIDEDLQRVLAINRAQYDEMRVFGFNSAIVVPLVARGVTVGVLSMASSTPGRFGQGDLGLVEELARRAGLAVENARLYTATQGAVAARDQFLSVAAHELRTPITAIGGFAALLQREIDGRNERERIDRFVRRLTDASGRLALLVDDMLDVSRIRLGQLQLRLDTVDLCDLVRRGVARYDEQLATDRHPITVHIPPQPCEVTADADRLDQVLANLLENAIKYSPEGGAIEVTLRPSGEGIELAVTDPGIGLPPEEVESIFRPFGRAGNAVLSNLPGLGIGLYICRNIVERHGGRIWAESAGEEAGTRFVLWIPIVPTLDEPLADV